MPNRASTTNEPLEAPPVRDAFARRLREARKLKYTFKYQMAQALGVEHETYRSWERAVREPGIDHLRAIAIELNVSLDFLIVGITRLPR